MKKVKLKLEATTFTFLNDGSLISDFGEYTRPSFDQHLLVISYDELEAMGMINTPLTHTGR